MVRQLQGLKIQASAVIIIIPRITIPIIDAPVAIIISRKVGIIVYQLVRSHARQYGQTKLSNTHT